MQAPPHIDDRLLVCYHAIFGISLIPDRQLRQLEKWTAFQQAHFADGKNLRRLVDFFAEFDYILAAFQQHDFLEEYRVKFGDTLEYKRVHVTTRQGITGLRCLERAMQTGGHAEALIRMNRYIARFRTPDNTIFPITYALGCAVMGWLRDYWVLCDPLLDRTALYGNTDMNLLYDEHERPAPREGEENAAPASPHASHAEPALPANRHRPPDRALLSPRAPRAHRPDLQALLPRLRELSGEAHPMLS